MEAILIVSVFILMAWFMIDILIGSIIWSYNYEPLDTTKYLLICLFWIAISPIILIFFRKEVIKEIKQWYNRIYAITYRVVDMKGDWE